LLNQFAEAEAQKAKATMKVTLRVRITAHSLPKTAALLALSRDTQRADECPLLGAKLSFT
jgi:hypothetical protein